MLQSALLIIFLIIWFLFSADQKLFVHGSSNFSNPDLDEKSNSNSYGYESHPYPDNSKRDDNERELRSYDSPGEASPGLSSEPQQEIGDPCTLIKLPVCNE